MINKKNIIKHYGRYGFPSDLIVDYSLRLSYISLNIMWNNFWRLAFFTNDWYYMSDFEHECLFWQKIYCVKSRLQVYIPNGH